MDRLFGTKKQEAPKPTLDDAGKRVEQRIEGLNTKIRTLELEAKSAYDQMKKLRDGPSKKRVKQKALKALKQKKQYEKQRDQLMNQSFTFDQMKFAAETAKDTAVTVEAMKGANQELQSMYKDIDVGDVEDIYDDMEDLMYMTEEIQDVMSREYGVPDDFDDIDLEAELEGLDEELAMYAETEDTPSYLLDDIPEVSNTTPLYESDTSTTTTTATTVTATPVQQSSTDVFGLPQTTT